MNTFTSAQISEMSLTDLVTNYNSFAAAMGVKELKKFESKAKGQQRLEAIQAEYVAANPVKEEPKADRSQVVDITDAEKPAKEKKVKKAKTEKPDNSFYMNIDGARVTFLVEQSTLEIVKTTDKPDSIRKAFETAIENTSGNLEEVINAFISELPTAPKSGEQVDKSFVIRRMKRLVRKGFFKLVQA